MFQAHRSPSIRFAAGLMASLALVATGCSSDSDTADTTTTAASSDNGGSTSGELTTLKVEVDETFWQEAFNYAEDKGWFEEAGLDIEPVEFAGDSAIPLVLNGQADVGITALGNVIVAIDNGMELKTVAGMFIERESKEEVFTSIVASAKSGVTDYKGLEGKKIAVNELRSASVAKAMMRVEEAGGDPSKIEWVAVPLPGMVEALERGDVDAAVTVSPFTGMAEAAGATWLGPLANPNDPVPVFFAKSDWATKNPEVAAKFIEVLEKAYEYGNSNLDEMKQGYVKRAGLEDKVIAGLPNLQWKAILDQDVVKSNISVMAKNGFIKSELDIEKVVETSLG